MLQQLRSKSLVIWAIVFVFFVLGFLLADTSGLLGIGSAPITPGTVVAEVNGTEIQWLAWQNRANQLAQQQEGQSGRGLTLDERQQIENQAFEEMVGEILLQQEYERRGIRVSDQEVIQAAQQSPPPQLMQSTELQTEGRFDIEKYRRFLRSPAARQQGLLLQLEGYYRSEIPKAKLFDQLAADVFVSDAKLWRTYQDQFDSTAVSFVVFESASVPDSAVQVADAELRRFYNQNRESMARPGRAVLTVLTIPRVVTSADSAATYDRVVALRNEITGGAAFEDVARRESADTLSAVQGGDLGLSPVDRYAKSFGDAAKALDAGELSQPVRTEFGIHLIRKDSVKGDSLALHHILIRYHQSDSNAVRTDRRADSLSRIAAGVEDPTRLDSAAKVLGLTPQRLTAFEGEPLNGSDGRPIPSVSAWAFTGARVGEISDLYDAENVYAIARLDTLIDGGIPSFDEAKQDIRQVLIGRQKAQSLVPRATEFSNAAAASTLESAAAAQSLKVDSTGLFTRPQFVAGLGRFNAAIGAAFTLPVGAVSKPVVTDQGAFVLRVNRRVEADSATWLAGKDAQRREAIQAIQQLRVRTFLSELRKSAKIDDRRKQLNAAARAQTTT